jgi:hypothetical protein
MKTMLACLATALVVAAVASGNVATVSPSKLDALRDRISILEARVTKLQTFSHSCLRPIQLSENADGVMAWNQKHLIPGGAHSAIFFGVSDTSSLEQACATSTHP